VPPQPVGARELARAGEREQHLEQRHERDEPAGQAQRERYPLHAECLAARREPHLLSIGPASRPAASQATALMAPIETPTTSEGTRLTVSSTRSTPIS
jgi:hypothetical protein